MREPLDWDLREVDSEEREIERSGRIKDLNRYRAPRKERMLVTSVFCIILLGVFGYCLITGDWTPLEKTNNYVNLILGALIGYFFGQVA